MVTRKQVIVNGVTLSYLEKNETASPAVFLVHGNSSSAAMWQKQLDSPELSAYRLIAVDLPGHGSSDGLEKEDYHLLHFGRLLAEAVNQLAPATPCVLVGFSFGANVVCEMLAYGTHPRGIVLLGPSVLGAGLGLADIGREDCDLGPLFTHDAAEEAVEQFFRTAALPEDEKDLRGLMEGYRSVRPPFRSVILESALEGKISDEIALLQQYAAPLLVVFGTDDRLIRPDYLDGAGLRLWKNRVHHIEGGSHFANINQAVPVNALLQQYVEECLKESHVSAHSSAAR